MRLNEVYVVGSETQMNAELCYSKRDAIETLKRRPGAVWCNAIELQIPEMEMSIIHEREQAKLN